MIGKKQTQQDEEVAETVVEEAVDEIAATPEEERMKELEAKNADLEIQMKRALADYQNLQRRVQDDRKAIVTFATESLVRELLPIVDHLDQAVDTAPEDEKKSQWFSAVEMTVGQLKEVLKREGLEEINPHGKDFDSLEHEAIDVIEGEHEKVTQVHQKGYKLHGKVVRPARVQVSKKAD